LVIARQRKNQVKRAYPMLVWKEIESSADAALSQFFAMYEASFPIEVMIPPRLIETLIERRERLELRLNTLHVGGVFDGDMLVGGAMFDLLHRSNIGFIDYIFVHPQLRGRRIGQFIYGRLRNSLEQDACVSGQKRLRGVLFEIENEHLAARPAERQLRTKRLRFFLRMGAGIISGVNYVQPPLHPGEEPLPMRLLFHPIGVAGEEPSPSLALSWVDDLYTAIYLHEYGVAETILADCLKRVAASMGSSRVVLERPVTTGDAG